MAGGEDDAFRHQRRWTTATMDSVGGFETNDAAWMDKSAEAVLRALAPECAPAVLARLWRERVASAADLARLDKEDLRDLGLNMLERSRVLAWAKAVGVPPPLLPRAQPPQPSSPGGGATPGAMFGADWASSFQYRPTGGSGEDEQGGFSRSTSAQLHLERLEQHADFWCSLASSWNSTLVARCRRAIEGVNLREVRESLLESLFDLSHDRVREVFESVVGDGDTSCRVGQALTVEQLRQGLAQYGLPEPAGNALHQLLQNVVESSAQPIQLPEFETVLSRLTLAQLVMLLEGDQRTGPRGVAATVSRISVVDYGVRTFAQQDISSAGFRRFFFGHRPPPQAPSDVPNVRWVHMKGLDLTLLLALTVKYNLHPLAVEDTIEQAPCKTDRHGFHYFLTIEGLCLCNPASEREPVRVRGYHVSLFAAGPPMLDTVVTFAQPDASFAEDWPDNQWPIGVTAASVTGGLAALEADCWATKIRSGLSQPLSRVRERRADFLVYKVLDVCTDEIMIVMRAYMARLRNLEDDLHKNKAAWPRGCHDEVVIVRQQLRVISRRVRGLQRAVRKLMDDRDLSLGLHAYLQDIIEHTDEVMDDCERLSGKCGAMSDEFDRAKEREREQRAHLRQEQARREELRRSVQADRQNRTLYILTVVTTILGPMQFMAGVYGMNFVDAAGTPSIPELVWPHGYQYFWTLTVGYLTVAVFISVALSCSACCAPKDCLIAEEGSSRSSFSSSEEAARSQGAEPLVSNPL